MTVLEEGDLQITIGDAINARKFDDATHGLNSCMKAVDFIVELLDCYLFIEIKDPQAPQTPKQSRNVSNTSTGTPFSTNGRRAEPTSPLII